MDQNVIDYFVKNGADVEKLMLEVKDYRDYLRSTLQDMAKQIIIADDTICKQWYYREANTLSDDLVHDFSIDSAVIAIDTVYGEGKYHIYIWLRKADKNGLKNKDVLINFLVNKGFDQNALSNSQERYVYHQEFLNQQDVLIQLNEMIKKICS